MAHIKINELARAPDMGLLILEHKQTGERQSRRVPAAIIDKYRQHEDRSRDTSVDDAWQEVPGFDANWVLVAYGEGALSTDTDTGWLEQEGDFFTAVGLFVVWVDNLIYTFELSDGYTITRGAQNNRVTVTPDPPYGFSIVGGFLDY